MRPFSAFRRPRRASAVALVLSLASLGPVVPVARAAPDASAGKASRVDKASHDRAQKAFQESVKLYKSGQYRAAVDRLVEARKLDPTDKDLPYNLGLVYEKLAELDPAIQNFELYVSLETDEAEKTRVRAIIQRLQGARAELARSQPKASASAPAPTAPPTAPTASTAPTETQAPRRRGRLDGLVYGAGGLAVVAVASGVFFGVRALGQRPSGKASPDQTASDLQSDQKKAHQTAVIADVSFGVAVLAGGAAALLYLLRDEPDATSSAFVAPTPGGLSAGWLGRF